MRWVAKFSAGKGGVWRVIAMACFISLFFAFPSYDLAFSEEMKPGWDAILLQTRYPFVATEYHGSSHQANLAFRLTPILIGYIFGIETIGGYLILQVIVWAGLLAAVFFLFTSIFSDRITASISTWAIALSFVGSVLCSDYRGFFDGLAYLLLVLAMLSKRFLGVFIALLLAYFTDERALICSGLVYAFAVLRSETPIGSSTFSSWMPTEKIKLAIVGSWAAYLAGRVTLSLLFGLKSNTETLLNYLRTETIHQVNLLPFGLFTGLEGFWIFVVLALGVMVYRKSWVLLLMTCFCVCVVSGIGVWVFDITRSLAFLVPLVFVSSLTLAKEFPVPAIRKSALFVFLVCLFPTYYAGGRNQVQWLYPAPVQVIRILAN